MKRNNRISKMIEMVSNTSIIGAQVHVDLNDETEPTNQPPRNSGSGNSNNFNYHSNSYPYMVPNTPLEARVQAEQIDNNEQINQPSTSSITGHSNNFDCHFNSYIRTVNRCDSDKDFDSDDSVLDKDYIPPNTIIASNKCSDSDSDSFIPNSQPLIPITIPETPEKCISGDSNVEVGDVSHRRNELLTKKGVVRKRRYFETRLEDRKKQKKNDKILNKYSLKPGCEDTCRKKCTKSISEEQRQSINEVYWLLTWKEQRHFIKNNTSCVKPVRLKNFDGNKENKNRDKSVTYFFSNKTGEKIPVCKVFFLTTLGYCKSNDKAVRNALNDKDTIPFDGRGYNEKKHKINHQIIKNHVESFKPTISHYRREHAPNKRYLPSEITVQFMYNEFVETNQHLEGFSYELYRKVIKAMNISFARLGHEECEICEQYERHNPNVKELRHRNCESCVNFENHKSRYTLAREAYDTDRTSSKTAADEGYFSADLQKVIMLPRIDMFKTVFFCPRLVVLNESFVPLGYKTTDQITYAAIWHEATSGRKKDDIISAFQAFLKHYRDLKKIILWLDNCSAQNKNWALFSFLLYFINSDETCNNSIILKYFETGHTFMSADEFHHQVEHALKKKKKIYDFEDFAEAVASTNNRKTVVKKMDVSDFFKVKDDTSYAKIQSSTPRAYLRHMSEICFRRGSKSIFYKNNFNSPECIELDCLKKTITRNGFSLPVQHTEPRGITSERKNNIIQKLGPLMPPNRKLFWEGLSVNDAAANLTVVYDD